MDVQNGCLKNGCSKWMIEKMDVQNGCSKCMCEQNGCSKCMCEQNGCWKWMLKNNICTRCKKSESAYVLGIPLRHLSKNLWGHSFIQESLHTIIYSNIVIADSRILCVKPCVCVGYRIPIGYSDTRSKYRKDKWRNLKTHGFPTFLEPASKNIHFPASPSKP